MNMGAKCEIGHITYFFKLGLAIMKVKTHAKMKMLHEDIQEL